MRKILLSWIGLTDFDRQTNGVSNHSPNLNFHEWSTEKYEKHILLTTGNEKKEDAFWINSEKLRNKLKSIFIETDFILRSFPIDPNSLKDINPVCSRIMDDYIQSHEIHVIFSAGTSMMSTVWALLSMEKSGTFKLFQGIKPENNNPAQFFEISLARDSFGGIKTTSSDSFKTTPTLVHVYEEAEKVAKYHDVVVLITGENGTGKEHLAKFIHQKSGREGHYVAVNCSAFSDELLESRLFGHKKGSFTGADRDHTGYFEYADKGTILLDEIGDISPKMQQTLLRVIQEKRISRVGDNKEIAIDVRIISATNKDLLEEVHKKNFRQDLYYRLNEANIEIPPLRVWGYDEINQLIEHFKQNNEVLFNKKIQFAAEDLKKLCSYSYPGNVRQLMAILKNIFIFSEKRIDKDRLNKLLVQNKTTEKAESKEDILRYHVKSALEQYSGNKTRAAKSLNISINTFNKYLNTPEIEQNGKQ